MTRAGEIQRPEVLDPDRVSSPERDEMTVEDHRAREQMLNGALRESCAYAGQLWDELESVRRYLVAALPPPAQRAGEEVAAAAPRGRDDTRGWQAWQDTYAGVVATLAGPRGDRGYARDEASLLVRARLEFTADQQPTPGTIVQAAPNGTSDPHPTIEVLVDQHHRIADQFRRTLDAMGANRDREFVELRRLLCVHETAEEVLVHPRVRWTDEDGDRHARDRIMEEIEIKERLARLEQTDTSSDEFTAGLEMLRAVALAHNAAEEAEEFPTLADELGESQLQVLERRVRWVERVAPRRPHPGLALGAENILAGGAVAIVDRIRDLIARGPKEPDGPDGSAE